MNLLVAHLVGDFLIQNDWMALQKKTRTWPAVVHVTLYTGSVWAFTLWPWWALALVWLTHFIQDRTTFVNVYMRTIGQGKFMQPPMAPWSLIVVDNSLHLLTLYLIAQTVGPQP